jgi:YidC/Oxa1 family membrane protein insertase
LLRPFEILIAVPLAFFAQLTGSAGLAVILLTLLIRIVLHPLTRANLTSMRKMQRLAPQISVLRRKYADNPSQLNAEIMNLYRSNGVNPLAGCLPMLLQLPVLFAMFRVFQRPGLFSSYSNVLPEVLRDQDLIRVSYTFLGIPLDIVPSFANIGANPVLALFPILSALVTYLQQRLTVTDPQQARMLAFFPIFSGWIALSFPVGLSLYWIVSTVLGLFEYLLVAGPPSRYAPAPPLAATAQSERPQDAVAQTRARGKNARRRGGEQRRPRPGES